MHASRSPHPTVSTPPLGPKSVVLLCLIYAVVGVIGHDPWKTVDAVNLAIAHAIASGPADALTAAALLVPKLAGEPWLHNPPLYHWVSAVLGNLLDGMLPWHDAARLASSLFLLLGLLLISLAARGFHGREASYIAPLLAIGSLGLLVPGHDAQPAIAAFAATGGVLAALAWWPLYPRRCALSLALAVGLGFLAAGLESLVLNVTLTCAALLFPTWRRVAKESWLIALGISGALVLSWPLALNELSPGLFDQWLSLELERLFSRPSVDVRRIELLLWGTWPVLPLSAWTLWLNRRQFFLGRHLLPLFAGLSSLILYFLADEANDGLPVAIAALAVLGSAEAGRLRRGAANAFDWFGCITLSIFMAAVWLAGISILTGYPARIAKNFTKFTPDFHPDAAWLPLLAALTATVCWLYMLIRAPRSPWRATSRWAVGIVCLTTLIACLMTPWVDHGKSYRSVAMGLRQHLGPNPGCIERSGVGSGQRASLDYFASLRTRLADSTESCRFLLVQTGTGAAPQIPGWRFSKDFYRPGDRKERLRLYQRDKR